MGGCELSWTDILGLLLGVSWGSGFTARSVEDPIRVMSQEKTCEAPSWELRSELILY